MERDLPSLTEIVDVMSTPSPHARLVRKKGGGEEIKAVKLISRGRRSHVLSPAVD